MHPTQLGKTESPEQWLSVNAPLTTQEGSRRTWAMIRHFNRSVLPPPPPATYLPREGDELLLSQSMKPRKAFLEMMNGCILKSQLEFHCH